MTLGERIKTILTQRGLKQVELACALGVSANYVNLLVKDKKQRLSEPLAKLIQELYGYSAQWVLTGEGEPMACPSLTPGKVELIKKVQRMTEDEVMALLAFAGTLEKMKATHSPDS